MIRVLVNGAAGRMGSEVVRSALAEDGLELCGGVDIGAAGKDLGEVIGIGHNGMTIDKTLEEAFAKGKPDVIVDFTSPKVISSSERPVSRRSRERNSLALPKRQVPMDLLRRISLWALSF